MKGVIFVILLAGYALSATYSSNAIKKCGGLNPYLTSADITHRDITGRKLELATAPLNPGQMCNQDWAAIGLCCDITQAKAYAINDKKIIDDAVTDLSTGLNSLLDIKKSLTSSSPQFSRDYAKFTLDKVTINTGLSVFGCGEYLKQVRSSVLCTICRADSAKFFSGSKGRISHSECSDMLEMCAPAINLVVKSLHGMFKIENEVMTNPKYIKYSYTFSSFFNYIKKYQLGSNLIPNINSYLEKNKQASNYDALSQDLCNKFYSLVKQPFLVDLGKLIRLVSLRMSIITSQKFDDFLKNKPLYNALVPNSLALALTSRDLSASIASTDYFDADSTTYLQSSSSHQSVTQNNALRPFIDLKTSLTN
jgi:hypothetical protein